MEQIIDKLSPRRQGKRSRKLFTCTADRIVMSLRCQRMACSWTPQNRGLGFIISLQGSLRMHLRLTLNDRGQRVGIDRADKVFFSGLDTNSFSVAEVISNTRGWWLDSDSARSLFSTPPPQTPGSFVYHRLFEDVCVQVCVDRLQSRDSEWAKKREKWRDIERNHEILWLSIININTWYADKLIGNNCLLK